MHGSHFAQEALRLLNTIRDGIANDLRPELNTDTARRSADSMLATLARLGERIGHGDALATAHAATWEALTRSLPFPTGLDDTIGTSPRDQFEAMIADLQQSVNSQPGFSAYLALSNRPGASWLQSVAKANESLWETIEEHVSAPRQRETVATGSTDISTLREKLNAYLHKRFPSLPVDPVVAISLYYGGYGKQSAKLTLVDNGVLPTTLVLRRDLAFSNTSTKSSDEFSVLERAYALGLPAPRPVLAEADPAVLDGTFLLMEEIPNAVVAAATFAKDRKALHPAFGPQFGRDIAKILATLHAKTEVHDRTAEERQATQEAFLQGIRDLRQQWDSLAKPPLSVGLDIGFTLLESNPLSSDRPHCLVHADCGMHNWLARDGKPVALLDWELTHEGDPAEDLAIIRMLTAGDVIPWDDFVAEYLADGGNPAACEEWAVAYHSVLLLNRHTTMAAGVRDKYHAGDRDDTIAASVATHIVDRLLQYQAKALRLASDAIQALSAG